jgi:hypothetical protein
MGYYSDAQVAALLPGATFMIADSRLRELSKDEPGRAEFWERLFWGVDSAFLHARIGGCIPLTGTRNAKQAAIITVAYDSSEDWAETVAMVRENRDASVPVVVCASWGDFDTNIREEIAHAFIDAGAALVLGEVKDTESSVTIHKDRPIFSIATTVRKGEATILSGILTPDRLSVSQSVVRATSTYDVTSDQKEGEVFWAPMSEYRDSEREGEWYTFPRTIH